MRQSYKAVSVMFGSEENRLTFGGKMQCSLTKQEINLRRSGQLENKVNARNSLRTMGVPGKSKLGEVNAKRRCNVR